MNEEEIKRLKQTLISLSSIDDISIPQRKIEIKEFVKTEKWIDGDFQNKIKTIKQKIINNKDYKIELKHVVFMKEKNKEREFHSFKNIYQQITVAYLIKNINCLNEINKAQKNKMGEVKEKFKLSNKTNNFGNIAYYNNAMKNEHQYDLFYPFYFDWREKWKEFINSFDGLSDYSSDLIIWNIDFKDSYNNLQLKTYIKDFEKNKSLKEMIKIIKKYNCEECEDIKSIIPYGGIVESHIIANHLILKKIKGIIEKINNKTFVVLDYFGYADDISIIIKTEKSKECFKNYIKERKIIEEYKIHPFTTKGKNKIFEIRKDYFEKDIIKIKGAYTSASSINSLSLPVFLREQYQEINYVDDEKTSRTFKQYNRKIIFEEINNCSVLTNEKLEKFIADVEVNKDAIYFFKMIRDKIEKNDQKKLFYKELLKKTNNKWWINNIEEFIMKFKFYDDFDIYKNIVSNDEKTYLTEFYDEKTYLTEFFENKINFYNENKYIHSYINKNKEEPIEKIIKIIKLISGTKKNKFTIINSKYIFGDPEFRSDHWGAMKKNLFIYIKYKFSHCYFIVYRFKFFLSISKNRVDFIKWMNFMQKDIVKITDLNLKIIYENDIEYLDLIKKNYLAYTNHVDDKRHEDVDKLFKIRILSKILWKNGSFSTQSYTVHNENHSDILLLRFVELRRSIKEIRNIINKNSICIFGLIASIYTHDLGMLFNYNEYYAGTLKTIYDKLSKKVRENHGRNSSSIILEWLASFLDIGSKESSLMSNSALAHEIGIEKISKLLKDEKNTIIILCILDLFDITSHRSQIISRKITGTISSPITQMHWIKHYIVRKICCYKFNKKIFSFEIEILDIPVKNYFYKYKEQINNVIKYDIEMWLEKQLKLLLKESKLELSIQIKINKEIPLNIDLDFFRNNSNSHLDEIAYEIKKKSDEYIKFKCNYCKAQW